MKHQARILIVEDEPAIAELIAVNLRHGGFNPVVAGDGEAAQRELDEVLPDAILLDWMLPGQSGIALARQWRKESRTKAVPILMLTARGDEPDRVAGLDATNIFGCSIQCAEVIIDSKYELNTKDFGI